MVTQNRKGRRRAARLGGPEALEQRKVLAAVLSMQGPAEAIYEGDRADFTLQLSERSARAETVFISTRPGTATLGVDYAAPQSRQVIFAPGETVKRFSIATLAEAVPRTEGTETFFVTATPMNGRLSAPLTRMVSILDAVPRPVIRVADIAVDEPNAGSISARFTLTLNAAYPRAVTVAYATRDGSATVAGGDYEAVSGIATFLPGQTTQTVSVNVNGDRIVEPDETFRLLLSSPTNATIGRGAATCTIRTDEIDAPGYQITLNFIDAGFGPVPTSVREIATEAALRWNRIIVGDLPSVTLPNGVFIDDLELTVQLGLLDIPGGTDGPSNVLANATFTELRDTAPRLPYQGITGLDPADLTGPLTGDRRAFVLDTITHEMGHALGFGTLWTDNGLLQGEGSFAPLYVGANALREYRTLFGDPTATGVPVEGAAAGPGSADSHWRETVFDNELMSPNAERLGIRELISRVTVGALQDLGYTVSYAAAEPYTAPAFVVGRVSAASSSSPPGVVKSTRSTGLVPPSLPSSTTTKGVADGPKQSVFDGPSRAEGTIARRAVAGRVGSTAFAALGRVSMVNAGPASQSTNLDEVCSHRDAAG